MVTSTQELPVCSMCRMVPEMGECMVEYQCTTCEQGYPVTCVYMSSAVAIFAFLWMFNRLFCLQILHSCLNCSVHHDYQWTTILLKALQVRLFQRGTKYFSTAWKYLDWAVPILQNMWTASFYSQRRITVLKNDQLNVMLKAEM